MKLLLISDLNKIINEPLFLRLLNQNIEHNILFIPSTPDSIELTEKYVNKILLTFSDVGLSIKNAKILTDREEIKENHSTYTIVFLMGGDTIIQNGFISDIKLKKFFNSYQGIVIAQSAGALNCCTNVFINKIHDDQLKSSITMNGLGIIQDLSLDVHFDISNNEQLQELQDNLLPVYCIPDQSAIIYTKGRFTFINEVYCIEKGRITRIIGD